MPHFNTDPDFYTHNGARVLAGVIERYWKNLGFVKAKVWTFEIVGSPRHFGIASNIGANGYPPE